VHAPVGNSGGDDSAEQFLVLDLLSVAVEKEMELPGCQTIELIIRQPQVDARRAPAAPPQFPIG
jgi:hypothetical protein